MEVIQQSCVDQVVNQQGVLRARLEGRDGGYSGELCGHK